MGLFRNVFAATAVVGLVAMGGCASTANSPASRADISNSSSQALNQLVRDNPAAAAISKQSRAVLIFPSIVKAGLVFGGAYGEGALIVDGAPVQYYSAAAGSFGIQIGIEQYSSALFFGTDSRLQKFRSRDGWTAGADLEYTAWDHGEDADIDNHTVLETVYGVVFGQEGLHIGATLEGSKYSTITR